MQVYLFPAVALLQLLSPVAGAQCASTPALSAAYKTAMSLPMSPACVRAGEVTLFDSDNTTTTVIKTNDISYLTLACALSECRKDFDASATALKAVNCDEAQEAASAMAGVGRLCPSLSLAPATPRCPWVVKAVAYPPACSDILPLSYFIGPSVRMSWKQLNEICHDRKCLEGVRATVTALPDCRVDFPSTYYHAGIPMSKKQVYLAYLSAFCDPPAPTPTTYDDTSCNAKLATLYATRFSDECATALTQDVYHPDTREVYYVLYRALYDQYIDTSRGIDAIPSCKAEVAALTARAKDVGPCASNVSLGFDVLQLAHSAEFTPAPSTSVPVCTKAEAVKVQQAFNNPASPNCTRFNPGAVYWSDIALAPLPEISAYASSPACVSTVAKFMATIPSCDSVYLFEATSVWIHNDTAKRNMTPTGVPSATRMMRYLLAAQKLYNASNPPSATKDDKTAVRSTAAPLRAGLAWAMTCVTAIAISLV